MITVAGIGRVGPGGRGQRGDDAPLTCRSLEALHLRLCSDGLLDAPLRHFGRMGGAAQRVCLAVAMALDPEFPRGPGIGIIGTSRYGCQAANLDYYRDYVQHGRQMARGGMFATTLPTTTLAQAAIQFLLQGPLLYVSFGGDAVSGMLWQAENLMLDSGCSAMAVVWENADRVWCAVMTGTASTGCGDEGSIVAAHSRLADVCL